VAVSISLEGYFMESVIIIGGGVAGLSCLNALLDSGINALLLEAGTIGTPKMCGEFLAPPALAQLQKWQIGPVQTISQASFYLQNKNLNFAFAKHAGAYARQDLELELAARARHLGGRILEQTSIQKMVPATGDAPYIFYFSSGEKIAAKTAIFATGKLGQQDGKLIATPYYGLKIHLPHIVKPETLLMYSQHGVYFGIVPVSDKISNCTCLAMRSAVEKVGSGKDFIYRILKKTPSLQTLFANVDMNNLVWLEGKAPEFGLKNRPDWPRAFWIGDALASLHPAIGYGFAHGISSAVLAAEAYLDNTAPHYHATTTQAIQPKLRIGKLMHKLMLNPYFGSFAIPILKANSWMVNGLIKKIGYC
jgi:flavin-dependent dehydrogenase